MIRFADRLLRILFTNHKQNHKGGGENRFHLLHVLQYRDARNYVFINELLCSLNHMGQCIATVLVLKPVYSRRNKSVTWLLMP